MRRFVIVAAALLVAACLGSRAQAQEKSWVMDYRMSTPLGNTSDFVGDFSWRGLGLEWHWMVQPKISAGVGFGFNSFWEETNEVVSVGAVDISGNQFRYTTAIPIIGMFRYHIKPSDVDAVGFYVGGDVGPYYIDRRATVGFLAADDDNWHFGVAAEGGIQVPIEYYTRGVFNLRYNYAFESGDAPAQSWLDLELGVAVLTP